MSLIFLIPGFRSDSPSIFVNRLDSFLVWDQNDISCSFSQMVVDFMIFHAYMTHFRNFFATRLFAQSTAPLMSSCIGVVSCVIKRSLSIFQIQITASYGADKAIYFASLEDPTQEVCKTCV